MPSTTVELRSVTKIFGAVRALVGVSLRLESGTVTVVEGANGSGKSTLLSIVGTLARATSGTIDHGALGRTRRDVRAHLGWLGHDALVYGDLSGRENVELAARLYGLDPREAYERAAGRFELGAFADRPFQTYSRGQRQRVALARALVHGPRLLLLDEPTSGLDTRSTERLSQVIEEERQRDAVIMVVTHDRAFADRVGTAKFVMERGRLVA